jgi:hypothetical protein
MRKIKTTKIGQNDYVDVSERVLFFWELHPDWSILTSIEKVDLETGVVIIKAWVEDEKGRVRSTGYAHEFQADKKSRVNMTSFVENCETSAIGRCLGTLGIGTEYGIASAFEVKLAKEKEAEMKEAEGFKAETKPAQKKVKEEKKPANYKSYYNKTLAGDATDEQLESITGKPVTYEVRHNSPESTTPSSTKEAEERLDDSESEEEYLVDLNRRVSMLKNEEDAKALASEGRQWSNNWVYKKDQYKALYKCISESFAAFKKSQDTAKLAGIKGGS